VEVAFKAKYENFVKYTPSVIEKYFKKTGSDDFNLEPKKTVFLCNFSGKWNLNVEIIIP
jgi:hypothetical protein